MIVGMAGYKRKLPKDSGAVTVDREGLKDVIASDCIIVRRVGHSVPPKNPSWPESWHINYELQYAGGGDLQIHYAKPGGTEATEVISRGAPLGELNVRLTNFFPNELVDGLLGLSKEGASQEALYERMQKFYSNRGREIPSYGTVVDRQPTHDIGGFDEAGYPLRELDAGFRDVNVSLLWVEAKEFAVGAGISKILIPTALGSEFGSHCKYGIVYTKLTRFAEWTEKQEGPEKAKTPATPEEAQEYLQRLKDGELTDWSTGFHTNNGMKMLFALPEIARDKASRNAGAFGVYRIKELFENGTLEKPRIKVVQY